MEEKLSIVEDENMVLAVELKHIKTDSDDKSITISKLQQ